MHKPETPSKQAPADHGRLLLPTPVAFVFAGILATVAAQLLVSADDFRRLYEIMGFELPLLLAHLIDLPVLLPTLYLGLALATLAGPRIVLPGPQQVTRVVTQVTVLGLTLVTLYAGTQVYLLTGVFNELQKSLQQ